jgi:hypothetical protein
MPSSLQRAAIPISVYNPTIVPDSIVRTDVLGSQHSGVRGGLITIGLDLHATGDTGDGFAAGKIGDVDEGVVERGKDTGNAEDKLALLCLLTRALRGWNSRFDLPRGPEVQAGCSPEHHARPSSWAAY